MGAVQSSDRNKIPVTISNGSEGATTISCCANDAEGLPEPPSP